MRLLLPVCSLTINPKMFRQKGVSLSKIKEKRVAFNLGSWGRGVSACPRFYRRSIPLNHLPSAQKAALRSSNPIQIVNTAAGLLRAVRAALAHPVCAIDTETTGLDPWQDRLRLVQLATPSVTFVIDADAVDNLQPLLPLLQNSSCIKVFQNAKFDLPFLAQRVAPQRPLGTVFKGLFDTMIAGLLLRESPDGYSLAALSHFYLDQTIDKTEQRSDWTGPLSESQIAYAAEDAAILLPLRRVLRQRLIDAGLVKVAKLEFDLIPIVADMEQAGFFLDLEAWERVWSELRAERDRLDEQVRRSLGAYMPATLFGSEIFNPDSPDQVLDALRGLGLNVTHTSENELKKYAEAHEPVADLLRYRAAAKAVTAFGDVFPRYVHKVTGRIHARYQQIGARTGRMSCRDPNVQQVPRRPRSVRACFRAPEGRRLIIADYSQIELRVAAALANDERMLEAYRTGQDLHRLTASLLTGTDPDAVTAEQRQAAKAVNFGLLFAMGARGLATYAATQYGVNLSLEQAEAFRARFFQAYSGIRRWHDEARRLLEQAKEPLTLRTVSGRLFRAELPCSLSTLLNTPVQGSAADIMKRAMVRVHHALASRCDARIVAVVHDELIVEAAASDAQKALEIVRTEMAKAGADYIKTVPFEADARIVQHWGEGD